MKESLFIKRAIELSKSSIEKGGFPVGAIIVKDGEIISEGISNGKKLNDPTSHAEVSAIRTACKKLESRDLSSSTLYSSMEPCLMCLAASSWALIPKIIYAISRNKLDSQHFEGNHDINEINENFHRSIELIHASEYENDALSIVRSWEQLK